MGTDDEREVIHGSGMAQHTLSTRVIQTVAEREGVAPTDLPPLYDAIDPEALDSIFTAGQGHLVFPYYGYRITVSGDGRLDVDDSDDA
ncbi:HalOD1 output domain-containing protein [Natrinema gelatinilyticum]|uniref:HalOD1 output domain-containing protein n=1 Tax=Natrinema gelatinilyticum TaxID=2961571 RepID=UPI0020C1E05F|nr:HalOD1 output domain-containing protein [Natrinema gelatinilyticum]